MADWVDPRSDPTPPYRGANRPLAKDSCELEDLIQACKKGRLYEAESWIASGRPLQMDSETREPRRRPSSPLREAIAAGNFDLVRLLLCNGYRADLERHSPLNDAIDSRQWDLLNLLLDWGSDPRRADVWRILDTYERGVFERFLEAGVDLTTDGAMAGALASSTRNRPLYGFAKAYRHRDARIQRALDVGLGGAIEEQNDKAVSLCLWAGADPRRRVADAGEDPDDDRDGMTAFERAVSRNATKYLRRLGFDSSRDDFDGLYGHAYDLSALKALLSIGPPSDWQGIAERFLGKLDLSERLSLRMTTLWEVEEVFALGCRLNRPDGHMKRAVRRLLANLDERDARRLFQLLRGHMDRPDFIDLIAHEKLAARYTTWSWQSGVDKALLAELSGTSGIPARVRRMARARLTPPPRPTVTHTFLEDTDGGRHFSREELYDLVWSEPLVVLAKRFGLSDNGLRKRCRAMGIPTPPRGYWQRTKRGSTPPRPALPQRVGGSTSRQGSG